MQFDLLRAFPYPVLRPRIDDYIDGDIQATVHFEQSSDAFNVRAEVLFAVSVPEIAARIDAGQAQYAVVFACRDTYFRETATSTNPNFEYTFTSGALRGEVLIYPYVVSTTDINDFTCPWINEEFGSGPFSFPVGSVLALDEPKVIYIDRETFKPISSAFVMVANDNLAEHEWRVDASNDKVRIEVSLGLKEQIDVARNSARNKAVLLNSIYFGAVVQCVAHLKQKDNEYESFRWANIFRQKLYDMNIDLEQHDEVVVAQQLMKYPFALVETYCFEGANE